MFLGRTKHLPFFLLALVLVCVPLQAVDIHFAQNNAAVVAQFKAKEAQRIVVVSPAASEILFALDAGKQVVGVTQFCNVPDDYQQITRVGGFDMSSLSVEAILACNPDLVYTTYGIHDYLAEVLQQYHIAVYISNATSIQAVYDEITDMGHITHHVQEAAKVTKSISDTIADVQNRIAGRKRPAVYWETWNSPHMSVGSTSFMHDILTVAGGDNIFADITEEYPIVSEEKIISRMPQVILVPDMLDETIESISQRSGWSITPAVKKQRIVFIDADITSRPGPRIGQAILLIAKQLHPEVF